MPSSSQRSPNACGSCVPSKTNTTPLNAKVMTRHTLLETTFMRDVRGLMGVGASDIVMPQATTRMTPLTPSASPIR